MSIKDPSTAGATIDTTGRSQKGMGRKKDEIFQKVVWG